MAETDTETHQTGTFWTRIGFDLEGVVGALAAWLIGILLGSLWGPLFWLGAGAAILVLMATRSQNRTPPDVANLVVAPCDGLVHSIKLAVPPTELRIGGGERLRVRIASSPFSTNPLHAPITGEITSLILEEPNPSVLIATEPDMAGLAVAHIAFESLDDTIGCSIATGGFGPRLDVLSEVGDPVRIGRKVGKRRLGGWCDIYLSANARPLVRPGQTLIGAETVLCRLKLEDQPAMAAPIEREIETPTPEPTPVSEPAAPEPQPVKTAAPAPEEDVLGDIDEPDEAAARLFKKLKDEAERNL